MKGWILGVSLFLLGLFVSPFVPVFAEQRFASSDLQVASVGRVPFDAIEVYSDEVKINVPGLRYARVKSNSMAPLITDKSVVFERVPVSPAEIRLGDVISFYEPSEDSIILHAVVDILYYNGGVYFKTMGLANGYVDPWVVPFANVKGIMVGTFK